MANESNIRSGFLSRGNSDVLGQFTITGGGASVPMLITGATNTILELRDQSSGDVLSVFKSDGTELFKVSTTGITVGGDYTLPLADGTSNQLLRTNGLGTLSFVDFGMDELSNTDGNMSIGGSPLVGNALRWDHISSVWRYGAQQQTYVAHNPGPSTISIASVCKLVNASSGTREPYAKVQAATSNTDTIIGLNATEMNTTTTSYGAVVTRGMVGPVDTSSYSIGDKLYVSTSGTLTTTPPTTGPIIYIGRVFLATTQGYIDVGLEVNNAGGVVTSSTFEEGEVVTWDGDTFVNGNPRVLTSVHNNSGVTISKGTPVYVSGTHTSGLPTVSLADSNGLGTYPAIGLALNDMANGDDGKVVMSGVLDNIDTSSYTAGDALYISSTAGVLTTTRPTASDEQVQKVGLVTRVHINSGTIEVMGAGRTNDVPNELTALTGVSLDATDLGTFTGTTITDNQDIKSALQELETAVEGAGGGGATELDDLSDVDFVTTAPTTNDTLVYNGTDFVPTAFTLDELTAKTTTSDVTVGELITSGGADIQGESSTPYLSPLSVTAGSSSVFLQDWSNSSGTLKAYVMTDGKWVGSGGAQFQGHILNTVSGLTDGIKLVNTDNTSGVWSAIQLHRNSSSPADDDNICSINFNGEDSTSTETTYAAIQGVIRDTTNSTEDGGLIFRAKAGNSWTNAIEINADDSAPHTVINTFTGSSTGLKVVNAGGTTGLNISFDCDMQTTSTNTFSMNYDDALGEARNFLRVEDAKTIINNRSASSTIEIRSNDATAGSTGEFTNATFKSADDGTNGDLTTIYGDHQSVALTVDTNTTGSWTAYTNTTAGIGTGNWVLHGANGSNAVVRTDITGGDVQLVTQGGVFVGNSTSDAAGYTLPGQDGITAQVLQTDGSGTVSWATIAAGGNRKFWEHVSVTNIVATTEDTYYWYPGGQTQGIRDDYGFESASDATMNWNQARRTGFQMPAGTYDIDINLRVAIAGNSTGSTSNAAYALDTVNMKVYKVSQTTGNSTFWSQIGTTQNITIGSTTVNPVDGSLSATGVSIAADEVIMVVLKGNSAASSTAYVMWDYTIDAEKTA